MSQARSSHKLSALNWCADGGSGRILRESETQVDAQKVQKRGRTAGAASSDHDIELAHRKQLKAQAQAEAAISSGSSAALLLASSCPSPASKRTREQEAGTPATAEQGSTMPSVHRSVQRPKLNPNQQLSTCIEHLYCIRIGH